MGIVRGGGAASVTLFSGAAEQPPPPPVPALGDTFQPSLPPGPSVQPVAPSEELNEKDCPLPPAGLEAPENGSLKNAYQDWCEEREPESCWDARNRCVAENEDDIGGCEYLNALCFERGEEKCDFCGGFRYPLDI